MPRTVVRLSEDENNNPVFFLEEPNSHERAGTQYQLLFPVFTFVVDPANGSLHIPTHELTNGQGVAVRPESPSDSLPSELIADRRYYVSLQDCDGDHIKLCGAPGASPIPFTSKGAGTNLLFVWKDTQKLRPLPSVAISKPVVREAGEILLNGLRRHPAIGKRLEECLTAGIDKTFPICLFFDRAQRSVESLPWEALYDTAAKTFLALDSRWPIVRLKNPQATIVRSFVYEPPLRILALMAATGPNVDAGPEWDGLYRATKDHDVQIKVLTCQKDLIERINSLGDWRFSAQQTEDLQNVSKQMREFSPQVLHLFGHGDAKSGELIFGTFEDSKLAQTGAIRVSATTIRQLASNTVPVWLAVLNACHSGGTQNAPESLASSLARSGFPVVVGMSTEVASKHTTTFTATYYASIMELIKSSPSWAFTEVDWASKLWEARLAIKGQMNADECVYWTIPLVYTRNFPFEILRIGDDNPHRTKSSSIQKLSRMQTLLSNGEENAIPRAELVDKLKSVRGD